MQTDNARKTARDYRASHEGKGAEYHAHVTQRGHGGMIWAAERRMLSAIAAAHPLAGRARHLDFACGTGRVLGHLAPVVGSSTGVDVSESMLEVARAGVPGAELLHEDITRSGSMAGRQFDLITAFRFFPRAHVELREEAMAALRRLLAPGGWIVINNHKNHSSATRRLFKVPRETMRHEEVATLAERHGLRIREARHIGVLPIPASIPGFPYRLLLPLESLAGRVGALRPLATHVVYVLEAAG